MKWLRYLLLLLPMTVIAQPIGEVDTAGTTWYDLQHNGSCGRMVAVDDEGYVHVAWMNGMSNWQRHVFYNVWDPATHEFILSNGVQVDAGSRSGYVTLDCTPDGYAVPFFHVGSSEYNVTACCDFLPRSGSFYCTNVGSQGLWAHGALDIANGLHIMATVIDLDPPYTYPLSYIRGQADCANQNGIVWDEPVFFDSVTTLSQVIATSRHSVRIAAGWSHPRGLENQLDNDLFIRISEDGGDNWQPALNVTQFLAGDSACCDTAVNPLSCIGDTLRVYTDASLLFDENDVLHAAFTARTYYDWAICGGESYSWIDQAGIWHWSEATGGYSLIASAFYFQTIDNGTMIDDGVWQTNVQRPCLAMDTTTGYLYCAYMQYDSNCYSDVGYPMADVFISVSTDNGARWSVGTNVTHTCPGENIPAPGSMHEREPTLDEVVSDGCLHLFYEQDHDAGSYVYQEGQPTMNEMLYQRIPVDSIPTTPLVPNYPLHYDSTGFVKAGEHAASVPQAIKLEAAYPNPFNSSTTIKFDLPRRMTVELTIFDLLGREVTTLHRGMMSAGQHQLTWSPNVGSGVYFLRLKAGTHIRCEKLMFLR